MRRPITAAVAILALLAAAACSRDDASAGIERAETAPSSTHGPTTQDPDTEDPTTTDAPTTTTTTTPTTTTVPPPSPAELAEDPSELARRLAETERATRDPSNPVETVRARAFELQQLYRQLGRTPEWDSAVLAAVPGELRAAVEANAAARREFRNMHSKLSDTLPAWRIVEPPPADELRSYYEEGEARFGVPWEVLAAVNLVETGFGRIRGTSIAGAQGPMQFMPATWDAYGMGGDINDPRDAILGAANYLAANGGGHGDLDNALWHYNHSQRYVRGVKHYASVMAEDSHAFTGYYHWQIVYLSAIGDVWLPAGYEQLTSIPVGDYVAANPGDHLGTDTT